MPFAPHHPGNAPAGLLRRAVARCPRLGALLISAACAGCAVGPDYKRPEVPLPAAWHAPVPPAAAPTPAADVTNTAWWRMFGDPDLSALIDSALEANKDLRIAAYRVEEFDAHLQVAAAAAYPQVSYNVSGLRQQRSQEQPALLRPGTPPTYNSFSMGLNYSWEVDLWGKVKRSNEAARAELLSTEEARRAVMLTVVSNVATTYVQLLGYDQQLSIARQTLKNRESAYKLLDTKARGGSATKLSVAQARALMDEVAAQIPQIERQIATLENALSVLAGRNPGPVQRRSIEALTLPTVPAGVPSDVLIRRPDVMAAEQTLVAANARIGLAKAQYFPTVSITGAMGLASDQLRWLLAKTARTGELSRSLTGPLFDGARIAGDVRQAEAVQKQMVERYLQAVQSALQETADALVFHAKADEQYAALKRQVESRDEVLRLSRMRYEGGESTFLEVLDAEREVFASQTQQAQGWRDRYLALVALYKAMGGGWMVEQDKLKATKPADDAPAAVTADNGPVAAATQDGTLK
ncbi:efflux transporter outer membrane subunit [Ideonella sp. BN130291]|uniref:efflux transporter outer membrane subunit n=1 Tax=Ideonella sp. BN130291 TaxID=3112940 RepID=UPI002E26443B|nr:efflux transporter outer membrane subunit [Ideonella sp. BN130291]